MPYMVTISLRVTWFGYVTIISPSVISAAGEIRTYYNSLLENYGLNTIRLTLY